MTQENRSSRQPDLEMIQVRRNPYLVDYRTGKNIVRHVGRRVGQPQDRQTGRYADQSRSNHTGGRTERSQHSISAMPQEGGRKKSHPQYSTTAQQKNKAWRQEQGHPGNAYEQNVYKDNALLEVPASTAEASTPVEVAAEAVQRIEKQIGETTGTRIQGLPADVYAAHPNWTEDFLTVNEYSRPGDPLTEVNNIFVHYTANPGTSAAQNRSYFEQLKDNHERSASAHFIIGYDGEILQCVPLDEIAYAVQTRNEDSISIECCYKADNGQFTQETYDSLIKLLKWLTDAYDLQPDDILRHYDCGGKKCPIYYTEHEDAWNKLKEDVKNL